MRVEVEQYLIEMPKLNSIQQRKKKSKKNGKKLNPIIHCFLEKRDLFYENL